MRNERTAIFIDIDGILADQSERFRLAMELAESKNFKDEKERLNFFYSPECYYLPDWMLSDKVVPGTEKLFNVIVKPRLGWYPHLLSSRYWYTLDTTIAWLETAGTGFDIEDVPIILKPEEMKFTKTPEWKASIPNLLMQTLTGYRMVGRIILVDDDKKIHEAFYKYVIKKEVKVVCYSSLEEFAEKEFLIG